MTRDATEIPNSEEDESPYSLIPSLTASDVAARILADWIYRPAVRTAVLPEAASAVIVLHNGQQFRIDVTEGDRRPSQ